MNKREQQRQDRRNQILLCSLDMIISRGYEAMKIRDIAKKLEISTGLFFNYFVSKEEVYEELVRIGVQGPENVLKFNPSITSPIKIFENITDNIFNALITSSMSAKMFLLMSQAANSEAAPEKVKEMLRNLDAITPVLTVIKKGQQLGEIKSGNPTALAVAYWGAVQGIAESYAMRPELPLPESSWVVDILRA
ncbi:TetR/AcrR family transcriptional regulator [Candidatus Clostridium radicumherbarum]|uniref:TetR/AcrR family transcriptional regulator n=1 Tax=Candidatus Clostridium radicumherbarum TaxID=3381662 RepID=A0ABW8TVQ1_9CLOT